MMSIVYTVCSLLAVVIVCGADSNTTENECVSSYNEFEKKTFIDNDDNKQKLYEVFYPPNGHLPYSVKVTYQTVQSNGTQVDIITQKFEDLVWIWFSSSIFLHTKPENINRCIFYTLYFFKEWIPPHVTIQVPCIQQNMTAKFLLQMTTLIKDYAEGQFTSKTDPGNVQIKGKGKGDYSVPSILNSRFSRNSAWDKTNMFRITLIIAAIFQLILVWAVIFEVVRTYIKHVVEQSYLYSYQHYGLMCGATVVALGLVTFAMHGYMLNINTVRPDRWKHFGTHTFYMCLLAVCVLPGIPIAAYFTYKNKPPPVPYIIMIPVALLFCCRNSKYAKSLVFGIALWINMMAVQILSFTAVVLAFVALAEPLIVATNTLILILLVFCLTNVFALLFTISAYLLTPRHRRSQGRRNTIIRAAILIPLLLATICYCISFAVATEITNGKAKEGDILSVIGSAMVPLIIGAVTFGLKKLIMKVLESPTDSTDQTSCSTEQSPLPSRTSSVVKNNDLSQHEHDEQLQPLET